MTREMLVNELVKRGYVAEKHDVIKNGVLMEGIMIKTERNINPVIYTKRMIKEAMDLDMSVSEVVDEVIKMSRDKEVEDFDIEMFTDKDYILNHIYIGMQRESEEKIIKKKSEFDGIEMYLYLRDDKEKLGSYSIRVNRGILESAGLAKEEAWKKAEENTLAETRVQTMANLMSEMTGQDIDELDMGTPLYVFSNESRTKGASAILDKKKLERVAWKHKTDKLVVLPSSVHEMLVVPFEDSLSLEAMSAMVRDVNENEVLPEEQLADRAYIVEI